VRTSGEQQGSRTLSDGDNADQWAKVFSGFRRLAPLAALSLVANSWYDMVLRMKAARSVSRGALGHAGWTARAPGVESLGRANRRDPDGWAIAVFMSVRRLGADR
jgi:hypothetical protein